MPLAKNSPNEVRSKTRSCTREKSTVGSCENKIAISSGEREAELSFVGGKGREGRGRVVNRKRKD